MTKRIKDYTFLWVGRCFFLLLLILSPMLSYAQTQLLTGTVVDENGECVIGANIFVQETKQGTVTDVDGRFSINRNAGQKIIVSYLGYITQTLTPKSNTIQIVLQEDAQSLDEVVVIGYGEQKMKNVTGSVTTISAKDLEDLPVSTLAEALQGQINGLEVEIGSPRPGVNDTEIYIRQSKTFNGISKDGGNATPLIIIDDIMQLGDNGQPSMQQFNLLDPSEVESITVLRDASAAIYGSRAANGVVLVKTKRGRLSSPTISYSGKFSLNDAISHSKVLRGSEYGRFYNAFAIGSGKVSNRTIVDKLYSDVELAEMDAMDYNWLDQANWKSALIQTHTLNVNGGNEKATYYAGITYYDQGANLGEQNYEKYTYRAGVDINLSNSVKLTATVAGNEQKSNQVNTKGARFSMYGMTKNSTKSDYNALHHMPNHIPWSVTLCNDDGVEQEYWLGPIANTFNTPRFDRSSITSWNYFALKESGSFSKDNANSWNANVGLSYATPFIEGLSFRANYATSHSNSNNEQASFPYPIAYANAAMGVDKHLVYTIPENYFSRTIFASNTQLAFRNTQSESHQMNFYTNYDKTFDRHSISAMFSIERREAFNTGTAILYENLAYDISDTYLGVGGPSIQSAKGTSALSQDNTVTTKGESGSMSYLGRIAYAYDDRYMLQFIFRSDASTKFAPENYWGLFPGVSAGWIASEEKWFKNSVSWIPYLKIRASWGRTGRDNIKAWKWKTQYAKDLKGMQFGESGGSYGTSLTPKNAPNRDMKWDTSDKFNLGFDLRFFDGRLSTTIDAYYDVNDNILNQFMASQPGIPIYAGGAYAEENFGRVDAYGTELSFNWRDRIGQVNYNVGMNFGLNNTRVKEWVPDLRYNKYGSDGSWEEGMSTSLPVWGFRTWKETSGGDGILRTQEDIDAYWSYLSANADAAGTSPKYLTVTNKSGMKLGMLAYEDVGGEMDNGVQKGPNGQILTDQDYIKLCDKDKTYNINTKLGAKWKGISFLANIHTSWGGVRFIDRNNILSDANTMTWAPDAFWADMYDETTNPQGKYPNLGVNSLVSGSSLAASDFWTISTLRCYIRNITMAYTLPKKWTRHLRMESVRFNLTGNNLWDLYNPYPEHYRNMYDASNTEYPTLRTWSLGVNVTF